MPELLEDLIDLFTVEAKECIEHGVTAGVHSYADLSRIYIHSYGKLC